MDWLRDPRSKMRKAIVPMLAILVSAAALPAQRNSRGMPEDSPALRNAISVASTKYKIPGIAAALFKQGQLSAIEVCGVRDTKSNAPVTANTVFEAGSLGEPVFAYAVLLLSAEGRINPGAPLTTYISPPYIRFLDATSASPATEPLYDPAFVQITAIRVMNHTSGMPDWARNQHLRFQSPPGQRWSYSNEAYVYLQHAIERITGNSFDDFVSASVLRPAGMARSRFVWQDEYAGQIATGYDAGGAPSSPQQYLRAAAATTLYTTIQEYSRFVQRLLASSMAQHSHESAVTQMLNPTVSVGTNHSLSWGLGVGLEKSADNLFFFERGSNPGFQSFLLASRKSGSGLLIFTNSENGFRAFPDIVAATLAGDHSALQWSPLHTP